MFFIIIVATVFLVVFLLIFNPAKRPFLTESDYSHHTSPWWELYYLSRYFYPVKKPDNGIHVNDLFFRAIDHPSIDISPDVTISAIGDLMYRKDIAESKGINLWKEYDAFFSRNDIEIANMEFAVNSEKQVRKILQYGITPEEADYHIDTPARRFDVISLANNHINDLSSEGIISTCEFLDTRNIIRIGANKNEEEVDSIPIIDKNGLKIAFLAYTFSTNGHPLKDNFRFGTNLVRINALKDDDYDPSIMYRHIDLARNADADLIVAVMHWGVEFEYYPPKRLIQRSHELMERGVDIIFGHHPHIINPVERYKTADGRNTVCCYSLGSITTSWLFMPIHNMSLRVEIDIARIRQPGKQMSKVEITAIRTHPLFFLRKGIGKKADHRIIPMLPAAEKTKRSQPLGYKLDVWDRFQIRRLSKEYYQYFNAKDGRALYDTTL